MFAAHITEDGRIQTIAEHLHGVAGLARAFAAPFGAGEMGHLIGLCHDLGKYSKEFQKRILENGPKVDHSTAGGQEILALGGPISAYCVMGHHGGLPNGGSAADKSGDPTLYGRLKKTPPERPPYDDFTAEISLARPAPPPVRPLGDGGFTLSFLTRMLFSCLVDADYLDTERFMQGDFPCGGDVPRGGYADIQALWERLAGKLAPYLNPTGSINTKRSEILQNCLQKAEGEKGLYTLTVPTGGGKTVSSLAFALKHAARQGLRRVIYVIPYTSIIEQNAAVFAKLLGEENVLEHHANVDFESDEENPLQKRRYLAAENWDAPVVVTTNVQFFESLFASKTSRCRKLHNIANSVIVFDEAQMLPLPFLAPCTRAIAELVHNYGCTAVLCSATQPALDRFFPPEIQKTEISENAPALYDFFRRTTLCPLGKISEEELAGQLNGHRQALCIVNTRAQAQNVFALLEKEGRFHLSTLMYPAHRQAVLQEIRARLKKKLPCRVVATSLIEAGVDVDFPAVFRARAGLDSILQAAGRCNREGKEPAEESFVFVFELEGETLPASQKQSAAVTALLEGKFSDLAAPEAITAYFEALYTVRGDGLDEKRVVSRLEKGWQNRASFPFRDVAEEFKLIEENTRAVLIPKESEASGLAAQLRTEGPSRVLLRRAGRYCVNIYERHYRAFTMAGMISEEDGLAVLTDLAAYDDQTGLSREAETGRVLFA